MYKTLRGSCFSEINVQVLLRNFQKIRFHITLTLHIDYTATFKLESFLFQYVLSFLGNLYYGIMFNLARFLENKRFCMLSKYRTLARVSGSQAGLH